MTFFSPCGPIRLLAAPQNILLAAAPIAPGAETALTPSETAAFARRTLAQRRASGAARQLARRLLGDCAAPPADLLVDGAGAPLWPAGFCGSLAHDETVAVAAVARKNPGAGLGLGVDVEADAPLPEEIVALVATPTELAAYGDALLRSHRLFVVKEACFKALFPLDRQFLEFHDIEVAFSANLATGRAQSRLGGACHFAVESGAHIFALALRES